MKFWRIFLFVTAPYALLMTLFRLITRGLTVIDFAGVLLSSVLFGLFFAFFIQWFTRRQMKRIVVQLNDDENMIREGGANHILNLEGVGGKLVLTNQRLVFKSHKVNIQVHQLDLPLAEIKSAEAGKTGFLNNVLRVHLQDGSSRKFIVFDPQEWVGAIVHK